MRRSFGEHASGCPTVRPSSWHRAGSSTAAALEQIDFGELQRSLTDTDLLVDAGRLRPAASAARLRDAADFVVVVVRPCFESLAVLLDRATDLSERTPLLTVVMGDGTYPIAEVDGALRETTGDRAWVLGSVAEDTRGAAGLADDAGRDRSLRRSQLARTVRAVTDLLAHLSSTGVVTTPCPGAA